MNKTVELPQRLRQLIDHYGISVNELAIKLGGARMKYYNLLNGKAKPDFDTTESILEKFPEISAEWFMRGEGSMLKADLKKTENEDILQKVSSLEVENRVLQEMYEKAALKIAVMGKTKGATFRPGIDGNARKHSYMDTMSSVRKRKTKSVSSRVQGVKIPTLIELFQ